MGEYAGKIVDETLLQQHEKIGYRNGSSSPKQYALSPDR